MPEHYIIKPVISAVQNESGFPNLSTVDLSCGEGSLVNELREKGCRAIGTRYKSGDYIIKNDRLQETSSLIVEGVDLTKPLPFDDSHFDVVTLTEVVEHLSEYRKLIYEVGRILKPGGILLLSTPNIHRLHSRICFLLTGTHKLITRRVGWDVPKEELYRHHISPVSLPYLHTLLHQADLSIERLCLTRMKFRYFLTALLYPAVALASMFKFNGGRHNNEEYHRGERELRRWMLHPVTLFSEQLFLVARKSPQPDHIND